MANKNKTLNIFHILIHIYFYTLNKISTYIQTAYLSMKTNIFFIKNVYNRHLTLLLQQFYKNEY